MGRECDEAIAGQRKPATLSPQSYGMEGPMSKMMSVIVTAAMMSLAPAIAFGADPKPAPDARERAAEALREGADKIMRALELMLRAVPQYDMPEVRENGDIIIRRRNPDHPRKRPPDGTDQTST